MLTKERESGIILLVVETKHLGVAQFGSVLEWGSRGRWFNSSHPDHEKIPQLSRLWDFLLHLFSFAKSRFVGYLSATAKFISTHTPKS